MNPGHVCGGEIWDVGSGTFAQGLFSCALVIRHWMMPKSEEAPAVCLCKALTVFYCQVDAVVLAIEVPAPGGFLTRAVWKRRIKNPRQLLYDDRSFWKLARLQIRINVFLFDVYVMVFGEVRLSIVEAVGR